MTFFVLQQCRPLNYHIRQRCIRTHTSKCHTQDEWDSIKTITAYKTLRSFKWYRNYAVQEKKSFIKLYIAFSAYTVQRYPLIKQQTFKADDQLYLMNTILKTPAMDPCSQILDLCITGKYHHTYLEQVWTCCISVGSPTLHRMVLKSDHMWLDKNC